MTDHAERPLLFLDVDGTLLPYGGVRLPSAPEAWVGRQHVSNPQLAKLDPTHGPRLLALPCALMWATAWMDDANEVIAPLLGLPELPVADLPDAPEEDETGVLHWKIRALVTVAAGRPFVWVDDEITDLDRAWVSTHHRGQALLHRVDSQVGLTEADFAVLDDWLREAPTSPECHESTIGPEDTSAL
ncbi:HAD domain-containing protein [Streptomyces sp. NPDC002845]